MGWVMLAVLAVCFTACSEDDDNDGYKSGDVRFEAYGPSPALRGSQLTFVGRNLDKVTKIVLPDNIEITNIEVVSSEKIKVTIPQNALEGYVKLITASGLELTSKTLLTYTEPISISKINPLSVKAGQKLTIEGDYLNLIQKVIFADNVEVGSKDFVTWERAKIEVIVPRKAQSGIIILADTAAIPLELESETELQVVLPSVSTVADLTKKKPGDVITIAGSDLDLVESVVLPNGNTVAFTVADNKITFTLPADVTDGAVVMVPASGVRVAIANIGIAVPSELVAIPATDIKPGDEITVKGINMELITTVTFPGVTDAVTPASKSATEIKVTMPAAAVSGDLVLNTASGNTASVAISTLKPKILSYNPSSVAAGSDVLLRGQYLDLVKTVTFGGNKAGVIVSSSAAELKVTVPVDAETGEVTLTMNNGETVTGASLEVTKPVFAYIPVLPGSDVEIKAGAILPIDIQNGDKLTGVQVNNANVQYILQSSTLYVLIPNNAGGKTALKLISSNGEVAYEINVIGNSTIETVIYEGPTDLGGGWGVNFAVPKTAFEGVAAGSILKIYYTATAANPQIKINNDAWTAIEFPDDPNFNSTYGTLNLPEGSTYEIPLTAAILNEILTLHSSWNSPDGIIIAGQNTIIAKISLITKGGGAAETTVYEGTYTLDWSGAELRLNKDVFAGASAGSTMTFYYTSSGEAQVKFQDANWTAIDVSADPNSDAGNAGIIKLPSTETSYGVTLTAAMLNSILTVDDGWSATGLIFKGQQGTISKITIK
jgi:hypothetical protein